MTLIERQQPSHWYLRDGTPFHEIAKKDGSGNRPVTLADARKVQALPSVTNVLGVLAKPGLDAWKIEQGIMAALTLPRAENESLDVFAHRVVADMGEQVEKAADFGTAIHNACEVYAINKELPTDPKLLEHLRSWCDWFDANVERVACLETVFVHHEHGYAGRVDMVAKLRDIGWAVVDFKTQKVKRSAKGEPKPAFYETWPLQLAAYRQAILANSAKDLHALVSVVIDSAQPGPVHVRVWNAPNADRGTTGLQDHGTTGPSEMLKAETLKSGSGAHGVRRPTSEEKGATSGARGATRPTSEENGGRSATRPTAPDYFGAFLSAFALWRYVKGYDPRRDDAAAPLAA